MTAITRATASPGILAQSGRRSSRPLTSASRLAISSARAVDWRSPRECGRILDQSRRVIASVAHEPVRGPRVADAVGRPPTAEPHAVPIGVAYDPRPRDRVLVGSGEVDADDAASVPRDPIGGFGVFDVIDRLRR